MVAALRGRVGLEGLPRPDDVARPRAHISQISAVSSTLSRARGPPGAATLSASSLHDTGLATPASPGHRQTSTRAEDRNRVMAFTNSTTTVAKRNSSPEFISSTCVPRELRTTRNGT